ncbi:protease modulator HflC [Chitinophaga japonensis]|uniref:Protein HflC n=1 Tax=Chitinophaga japonensis TaxID=104662 RepID=A0A562T3A2_CHIJA|nr:protease modulator HflC [Chitinophaga japonensis]TWI88061.1 membrane protease subunit HflC [Chitinophaga japonensis]
MPSTRKIITGILIFLAIIAISGSMFILDETEQAIVTQFGKPVGKPRVTPGVNFKMPFIQKVKIFDKRYLAWDGDPNQVPTKDKKFIFVDTYARWQITDPLQFFIRLRDQRSAMSRLDDIIDGETRNAVASHELLDLVRSTNRKPEVGEDFLEQLENLDSISVGRDRIEATILKKVNERTTDLGIRILDFRFRRVNYVDEVRNRVYDRMISERNRIAEQFKSEGQGEALKIRGNKERDLAEIQSSAVKEAQVIRGKADAQASAIYARAYNKSSQSRELYSFIRSMEALERSLDSNTNVVLTTNNELFKFLQKP